jgi:hypothetical protein
MFAPSHSTTKSSSMTSSDIFGLNLKEPILRSHKLNAKEIVTKKLHDFIPCLLLQYPKGSSKIFLYFHANAEDLGRAQRFLSYINMYLKMHVLAVEYPGYGLY